MIQRRLTRWMSALLVAGAFLTVGTGIPTVQGQSATPQAVTAPAPDWTLVVHGMQDPYVVTVTNQREPDPGMRFVGFDVEVVNASDQPLIFGGDAVSVRDDAGFTFRSGSVAGSEPPLLGRTLTGGERARGWVWFAKPVSATLREIVLVPSAPELRLGLDAVARIAGTPGPTARSTPDTAATPTAPTTPPAQVASPPIEVAADRHHHDRAGRHRDAGHGD